jgi:hypothetical protein
MVAFGNFGSGNYVRPDLLLCIGFLCTLEYNWEDDESANGICRVEAGYDLSEPQGTKSGYCCGHFRDCCFQSLIGFRRNDACQPNQGLHDAARCCLVMDSAYSSCTWCGWLTDDEAVNLVL